MQFPRPLILSLILWISGCGLTTTRPKVEMSMAQAAFLAAQRSNAQVKASGLFRKAEFYYLKAKSAYRRKNFNKAKQYAILSRKFAERAEYISKRKKQFEN